MNVTVLGERSRQTEGRQWSILNLLTIPKRFLLILMFENYVILNDLAANIKRKTCFVLRCSVSR